MAMIIGLSVLGLTTIAGGILSNADELRRLNNKSRYAGYYGY